VYEKQHKLKIMMTMHGLKDGPYWIISYAYFFALSVVYIILLVIFGSLIGKYLYILSTISHAINLLSLILFFIMCRSPFLHNK
jgi:hypothetical protein